MSGEKKVKPKKTLRFSPCTAYDLESNNSWLGDMSAQGLHLHLDGFWGPVAVFDKGEPKRCRYRLEALPQPKGFWREYGKSGDSQTDELYTPYGWERVAKRGKFLVCRCEDDVVSDTHTSPQIQEMTIDALRKRERFNVVAMLLCALIYPLIFMRGRLVLDAVMTGTTFLALLAVFIIFLLVRGVNRTIQLGKLHRKLSDGVPPNHEKDWKRRALSHYLSDLALLLVALVLVFSFAQIGKREMEENKTSLDDYTQTLPFPTLSELMPGERYQRTRTNPGDFGISNTISRRSDLLAPDVIEFWEHGETRLEDGSMMTGVLIVNYAELAFPFLAKQLAQDYISLDNGRGSGEAYSLTVPGVEFAVAYTNIYPTLVMHSGTRTVRVVLSPFTEAGESNTLSVEELADIFSACLK